MMSIRFLRQAVAYSLVTLLVSAIASAQPPGGGGGRGGFGGFGGGSGGGRGMTVDRAMLLRNEQVRTELKIEEAQAATIDAALEAYREERSASPRPDRDAIGKMSEEERTALFDKMRKEGEGLSKKTDEVLGALLETEQTKRLDQISFQMKLNTAMIATLKGDDLKSKLSLTEEQIAKLDELEKAAEADRQKMFEEMRAAGAGAPGGGGGEGFAQMQEKMQAARKKTTDAATALLTAEQNKTIEDMSGAKFELDMRAMFGGGRGVPGGGGQGGGGGRQRNGGGGKRPPAE